MKLNAVDCEFEVFPVETAPGVVLSCIPEKSEGDCINC
jgi:hypothetical protein